TVTVCGTSVVLTQVTVSPLATDSGPGENRSVAWIIALGTKCSEPAIRTVLSGPADTDPASPRQRDALSPSATSGRAFLVGTRNTTLMATSSLRTAVRSGQDGLASGSARLRRPWLRAAPRRLLRAPGIRRRFQPV